MPYSRQSNETAGGKVLKRKVIYLAGPYRAPTIRGVVENIRTSENYLAILWKLGFACISPHMNSAMLDGVHGLVAEDWLDGDFEIIRRCDALFLLPRWEESEGTLLERGVAKEAGIPVFSHDRVGEMLQWREKEASSDQES